MNMTNHSHFDNQELTQDTLLGGKVGLYQLAKGYRAGIDPLFLSASIMLHPGERVLDVGIGAGAASLCLYNRVKDCRIIGIEIQRELVRIANQNIALNGASRSINVIHGDFRHMPPRLVPGSFDHVMANPPYFPLMEQVSSPYPSKKQSNMEGEATIADWMKFCLAMARHKGMVTWIYKVDRLDEVFRAIPQASSSIKLFPLWQQDGKEAKRAIIQIQKGIARPFKLCSGMTLHNDNGDYTSIAQAVLRDGHIIKI